MIMTAETTLLKCSHCSKNFKYDSERKRHEQSHYPEFQCKVCSKNFSFLSALRRHEKQHQRTGSVTCDKCTREFRDHILLKRHIKYAHGGSYTCAQCSSTFNSQTALSIHMQTHKSISERRYQCSFEGCNKKFNFPHHLKHHELTHTNSKQHFCKICGKGFIQSHHLKSHLKTHDDESSLYCTFPECNKKFTTEYSRKRHVAKYHIKTDSGISSDSNSASDALLPKNATTIYNKQSLVEIVTAIENKPNQTLMKYEEPVKERADDLSINKHNKTKILCSSDDDIEVNNCKSALGSCIVEDKHEACLCIKISEVINNDFDFTPVESIDINKLSIGNNDCNANICCGGKCGNNSVRADEMPLIEYKTDGTVKIKEFLDIDLSTDQIVEENDRNVKSELKFVPYNSCKDVLGNCIVSGNGTIGDGCLCAKMIIDEQVTAQEIDDITPHPEMSLGL